MPDKAAERFHFAVAALDVQPDDRLLEIGCGHGLAVALICPKLGSGKIVALDRSAKMIAAARQKNRACVEAERAEFREVSLGEADFSAQFSKIFAMNVNLFWTTGAQELDLIRRWLLPGGRLYLFYEPPDVVKAKPLMETIPGVLAGRGFSLQPVPVIERGTTRLLSFIACPA